VVRGQLSVASDDGQRATDTKLSLADQQDKARKAWFALTREIEMVAAMARGVAALAIGGGGRSFVLLLFVGRGLPQAAAVGVAFGGFLVLFRGSDAGGFLRAGGAVACPGVRCSVAAGAFGFATAGLGQRNSGRAADQSTE
jgi:hypothetical protein